MRKILLIISLSILPFTCFGASGNCEWLPYSTMGTAAGGAAASSNGGLLLSTASSSSTSGGLFCDWVNVDEKEKIQFIFPNPNKSKKMRKKKTVKSPVSLRFFYGA